MLKASGLDGAYYANGPSGSRHTRTSKSGVVAPTKKPAAPAKKRPVDEPAQDGAEAKRSLPHAPIDNKASPLPAVTSAILAAHTAIDACTAAITRAMTSAILLGTKYTAVVPTLERLPVPVFATTGADMRLRLSVPAAMDVVTPVCKMPAIFADARPGLPRAVAPLATAAPIHLDRMQACYIALVVLPDRLRDYHNALAQHIEANGFVGDANDRLGELDHCLYALRAAIAAHKACKSPNVDLKFVADYDAVAGDDSDLTTWLPRALEVVVDFTMRATTDEAKQFCARLSRDNSTIQVLNVTSDMIAAGRDIYYGMLDRLLTVADSTIPDLMNRMGYYDINLPVECLRRIAEFCDRSTRRKLALTCKTLADVVAHTWTFFRMPTPDVVPPQRLLTHRLPRISTLDVSLVRDFSSPYVVSLLTDALPTRIDKIVVDRLPGVTMPADVPRLQPRKLVLRGTKPGVDTDFSQWINAKRLKRVVLPRKVDLARDAQGVLCLRDPADKLDSRIHLALGSIIPTFANQTIQCGSKENACVLLDIIATSGTMTKALLGNKMLVGDNNIVLPEGEEADDFIARAQADFTRASRKGWDSAPWQESWFPHLTTIEAMEM